MINPFMINVQHLCNCLYSYSLILFFLIPQTFSCLYPKACSRCKQAWYCSGACQKKAWAAGHKQICKDDKDAPLATKKGMATPMEMWELVQQGVEEASGQMDKIMEKY